MRNLLKKNRKFNESVPIRENSNVKLKFIDFITHVCKKCMRESMHEKFLRKCFLGIFKDVEKNSLESLK